MDYKEMLNVVTNEKMLTRYLYDAEESGEISGLASRVTKCEETETSLSNSVTSLNTKTDLINENISSISSITSVTNPIAASGSASTLSSNGRRTGKVFQLQCGKATLASAVNEKSNVTLGTLNANKPSLINYAPAFLVGGYQVVGYVQINTNGAITLYANTAIAASSSILFSTTYVSNA